MCHFTVDLQVICHCVEYCGTGTWVDGTGRGASSKPDNHEWPSLWPESGSACNAANLGQCADCVSSGTDVKCMHERPTCGASPTVCVPAVQVSCCWAKPPLLSSNMVLISRPVAVVSGRQRYSSYVSILGWVLVETSAWSTARTGPPVLVNNMSTWTWQNTKKCFPFFSRVGG